MPDRLAPLTLSIMYCLDSEQGHIFSYNRAFGEAARLLGWEHRATVRAAARVAELPPGWTRTLGAQRYFFRGGLPLKFEKEWRLIVTLARYLRALLRTETRPIILVLEWFHLVHLFAFCASLLAVPRRRELSALFVYRFAFPNNRDRILYKLIMAVVRALIGREHVTIFTETEVAAAALRRDLGQPAHLLPIPNVVLPDEPVSPPAWASTPERAGKLVCWWPGVPAVDKGLALIERLTTLASPAARELVVVADQRAGLSPHPGGCGVHLLADHLSRAEYAGWLATMDVALLPYAPSAYANRTSGVLADAVCMGKLPVVRDGTWLARELRRYALEALIVDWDDPDLPQTLISLAQDAAVRAQLERMSADYLAFHGIRGYARTLERVLLGPARPPA
ncbi:MAG: hypothetical protein IT317_07965 [Anaerolineales bacterium]|nr:hypothetical protein [Anaerolineales bacterium]